MRLSDNFYLQEFITSEYAERNEIDNVPDNAEIENLKKLCRYVLQPLRNHLGRPITITSGYRSPIVNKGIGGAEDSQHTKGQAADIIVPGLPIQFVIETIKNLRLNFDQAINEFDRWVHVSYNIDHNRGVFLRAYRSEGKTYYSKIGV